MAIRKRRWVFIYLPLTVIFVLVALLFTSGLPLTPFARMAKGPVQSLGWSMDIRKVLLRGHFDGRLSIVADDLRLGDNVLEDAVTAPKLRVEWRFSRILGLSLAPSLVELEGCTLRAHKSRDGFIVVLAPPKKVADEQDETQDKGEIQIPDYALPGEGDAMLFRLSGFTLLMPGAEDGPELAYGLETEGRARREGGQLHVAIESLLNLDGQRLTTDIIGAVLDLSDMNLSLELRSKVELDTAFDKVLAELPNKASGQLQITARVNSSLMNPDGSSMSAIVLADGLAVSGAPFQQQFMTGPMKVETDLVMRDLSAGHKGMGLKLKADFDKGALMLNLGSDVELDTSRVAFDLDMQLGRSATAREFIEAFGLPEIDLGARIDMSGEFDAKALSLRKLKFDLASEPFRILDKGREYSIPAMEFALSGALENLDRPLPDAGLDCTLSVRNSSGRVWSSNVGIQILDSGRDASLSIDSRGFGMDLVADFLPENLGVKAAGQIDFLANISGDIQARSLAEANVELLVPGDLFISAPEYLGRLLVVKPFAIRLGARPADGLLCVVDPFRVDIGPISLISDGIEVLGREGEGPAGRGSVELGPVQASALVPYIGEKLAAALPFPAQDLEELGLELMRADLELEQYRPGALAARLNWDCRFRMNEGVLAFSAVADLDSGRESWSLRLDVPDFVQAQWKLALLRSLPLPELDLPMHAWVEAAGGFDGSVERARWMLEAGPGQIRPTLPLGPWESGSLPLDRFALGGSLGAGLRSVSVDLLELFSGRAELRFSRVSLESDNPLTKLGGARAYAGLSFGMKHWYVGDFVQLFGPGFFEKLGAGADELKSIGLESFDFDADIGISADSEGAVAVESARSSNLAVFLLGQERVPVNIDISGETGRLLATARIEDLRPDRIQLPMLDKLPISLSDVQIPFGLSLALGAAMPGSGPLDPSIHVLAQAGPGRVIAGPMLAEDLPLKFMRCELDLKVEQMLVENMRLVADFDGPVFAIERADISLLSTDKPGLSKAGLRLEGWTLPWLWAKLPKDKLPENIRAMTEGIRLAGGLDSMRLDAEFEIDPAKADPSALRSCALDARVSGIELKLKGYPALHLARLDARGGLDSLRIALRDAGLDGAGFESLDIELNRVLAPECALGIAFRAGLDLSALHGIAADWDERPELLEGALVRSLRGRIGLAGTASLHPFMKPIAPLAGLDINYDALGFDSPQPGFSLASIDGATRIDFAGEALDTHTRLAFSGLSLGALFGGDAVLDLAAGAADDTATARLDIDLAKSFVTIDALHWSKPAGVAASLGFGAGLKSIASPVKEVDFSYYAKNLLFNSVKGVGTMKLDPAFEGPLGPLCSLSVKRMDFDRSDLGLDLSAEKEKLVLALRSGLIDLPDILRVIEPLVCSFNTKPGSDPAASESGTVAGPASRAASAQSSTQAPAAPARTAGTVVGPAATANELPTGPSAEPAPPLKALPDMELSLNVARLQTGLDQGLDSLSLRARVEAGEPSRVVFGADIGAGRMLTLALDRPVNGRFPLMLSVDDVGLLLSRAVSPIQSLPPTELAAGTLFGSICEMPDLISGGTLTISGDIGLQEQSAKLDLRMDKLVLRQDITFLTRLAGLAKKRVILEIPFSRFELNGISANPEAVGLTSGYIDGPITLILEKVDLSLIQKSLQMRGRVFGVCFEVAGPLSNLQFFLCSDSKVIQSFTDADDFDW